MSKLRIELLPLGEVLCLERDEPLEDYLFAHGVEFPCGGRGLCKGCKIKVLSGSLPVTHADRQKLSPQELAAGFRLACQARPTEDLQLELEQWEAAILSDDTVFAFTPQEGLGVAVDLGTTTLVAQLVDLETGQVMGVQTALNHQARHGADIMSRVEFAVAGGGRDQLACLVREQIGSLLGNLVGTAATNRKPLKSVVIVGNTVMHHLFCGLDLEPLSHFPFEPASPGLHTFTAAQLGWNLAGSPSVHFLPCFGGFVGSDILAGVLATKLHESDALAALIDLGTNGEIAIGNRERILCASTAAGPAFEGARISMGMRAATGAISQVELENGAFRCHVIGHTEPRGICGSGLVDAVATSLDAGWIKPNGRLADSGSLMLAEPVSLSQWDVRELQLAKGAIAAGVRILLAQWGATAADLSRVYLAGAFGNYISQASARRVGLLQFPAEKILPSGNTALLGAKLALFDLQSHHGAYPELTAKVRHVSLHEDPAFQETYVEEMLFPAV